MKINIIGHARLLGAGINTDINCSSKYLPGKDAFFIARHAFDNIAPGFAKRFKTGDVIIAGENFGINSSREQAVHIMHLMGVAAIVAPSFGRQFFRNAINNGLPIVECDITGIAEGDEVQIDLSAGRVTVDERDIDRTVAILPAVIQLVLALGGLIPFLQKNPDWKLT